MDNLPVAFASRLSKQDDGTINKAPLNNVIKGLSEILWKEGGFRFWHRRTDWDKFTYQYYCSQDAERSRDSVSLGVRHTPRMERFSCKSSLTFKPSFDDRTLAVTLRHDYHTPYLDYQLSSSALDFIHARNAFSTPSEIYRDLQAAKPSGWEIVSPQQVYYQWHQSNSKLWRQDSDQFRSAEILLSNQPGFTTSTYIVENVRALAFYILDSINPLVKEVKELAMDSTFGTNNAGMSLFAVLAEVDGTGVPLAYCFVDVFKDNKTGDRYAVPGAIPSTLEQFLRPLRAYGCKPTFFGTDKDFSEIWAIHQAFPEATIQLCFWHARRAIRTKLSSSQATKTQAEYKPQGAQMLIPELEICWGSMPTNRPNGDHRNGSCTCPSRSVESAPKGRLETSSNEEKDTVLSIFTRHYNSHPLIPDQNGTYRTANDIHRACTAEMYHWCKSRNYFRLWAYLWVNWYQPNQWALWARSENANEIPVLKTTMIVESHWRKIKHDCLHRFNRPRIDLVVWVLTTRAIPDALTRLSALRQRDYRKAIPSWRKDFKREWKINTERSHTVESLRLNEYHSAMDLWVPPFLELSVFVLQTCYFLL